MGIKEGVILINLGTPEALTIKAIKKYLREFLSDSRVITLPGFFRWLLLNLIILPFRPKKTLAAYSEIWMEEGSPLMFYSRALENKIREQIGHKAEIMLAMRYGQPSIKSVLEKLASCGIQKITLVPLYPQYASATTGTVSAEVFRVLAQLNHVPAITVTEPFYYKDFFVKAMAQIARPLLSHGFDHIVFSYHGLPESHLQDGETGSEYCLRERNCCSVLNDENRFCYRAHCIQTTKHLAKELNLSPEQYTNSFQSRLGRQPWTSPSTSEVIKRLAEKKIRRLIVFCPAFVADCVETLEEIGIGEKEVFLASGGESFVMIPCVNVHPIWVKGLSDWIAGKL